MRVLTYRKRQMLNRVVIWMAVVSLLMNSFQAAYGCGGQNPDPASGPPPCGGGGGGGGGFGGGMAGTGITCPAAGNFPVYFRQGSVVENGADLAVKAPGISWSFVRSYDSLTTGTTVLGTQWLTNNTDYKLVKSGTGSDLALLVNASSKFIFTYSGSVYVAPKDTTLTLVRNADGTASLTNTTTGTVDIFYGYGTHEGLLKERTTLAWKAQGRSGVRYTWNSSEQLTQITTAQGQDYNIVFSYAGTNISKIEVRTGADTSSRIQEVDYTYFTSGTHSADVGQSGHLVQVKTMRLRSGGSVSNSTDWIVRYTQYRYGSNGLLKMVLEPDAIQRILDNSSLGVSSSDAILTKGDNYDNSAASSHKIKEYANRQFTYYSADLATDNSNSSAKCLTAWAPTAGENLHSKYGGTNINEIANSKYLVKSETVGACSGCGSSGTSLKLDYYYLQVSHTTANENQVTRLVIEDTSDGSGNAAWRRIYGLSEVGRALRQVQITDVSDTPQFWCQSWTLVADTGNKLRRVEQYRTPAAHNVTNSNVSQYLNPYDVSSGGWTNDTNTLNASVGRIAVFEYNDDGYQTAQRVKVGNSGTAYYQWALDCLGGTNANRKALISARYLYPVATTDRAASTRIQTQFNYTFWTGTDTVRTVTTTLPSVSTDQNGSGTSTTITEYFDALRRPRWFLDGRGYVTYYSYHPQFGTLAYMIRDANPSSLPTSADGNSTKWVTSSNGSASSNAPTRGGGLPTALQQVARSEFDNQGRTVLTALEDGATGTMLRKHYSVYQTNATLEFPSWDDATSLPLRPVEVSVTNNAGIVTDLYSVDPARTATSSGVPTGLSSGTNQSHYVHWLHVSYDTFSGQRTAVDRYHVIPSSGYGTKDTNYAENSYGYDSMGRQTRVVGPSGTIWHTVYDTIGRDSSTWIGTDDTPTSGSWSPTNNAGANMVKILAYEYDGGNAGGNSNRTKEIRYVTDDLESNARVTHFKYDARDRLTFKVDSQQYDGKALYSRVELDNLGRVTRNERYYDANGNSSFPTDGTVDTGDRLLARSENLYDSLGHQYRSKSYTVNPGDGAVGSYLVANTWFDANGNEIKQQALGAKQFTKTVYNGLGQVTARYLGYDTTETSYSEAGTVSGDTVLEQSQLAYDPVGHVIQVTNYARKAGVTDTGELSTSSARVSYLATWHDGAGRPTAAADYGTNGGGSFTRPSTTPTRSDTVLLSTTAYNSAGNAYQAIDAAGKEIRREFDHAGRVTRAIQNYVDGDPTTGTADQDLTVQYTYNSDDNTLTRTSKNPTTGDQVTKYVYGTDQGGITPAVYRNDFLRAEIYPDSDDAISPLGDGSDAVYQRIEYTYNRRGERVGVKDLNGSVHDYDYDSSGRLLHDRVSTVGTGVDNAVLRISRSYDLRGYLEKLTSYDNATVGSGNVLNEVVFAHDSNGQLISDYQEHSGAKSTTTLSVGYNYDSTASSGEYSHLLRPTSIVYPNGRLVHFTYGTSQGTDDVINRIAAINDDSSGSPGDALVQYTYLGHGGIVGADYAQVGLRFDLDHGTAGEYAGLDRFGRKADLLWRAYTRSTDAVRIQHGYDRVSNRLWRQDPVATAASANQDELYTYDGANQLTHRDRGALNSSKDAVTSKNFAEDWTLDMTGNWPTFKQDTDGDGTWDLNQSRAYNTANQVTQVAGSSAHVAFDRAGNMTRTPKPGDWSSHLALTFDAWNRLVGVVDGETPIASYAYDGRHMRITETASGTTRHFYYSGNWQVLEERVGTAARADRQFVWGLRYIDDFLVRDRDADANAGTGNLGQSGSGLEERLYGLQDTNWNVVALAQGDGAIVERYGYTAYGKPTIYAPDWSSVRTSSAYANTVLYTGRQIDLATNLSYYRARHYSADLGRFIGRDPVESDENLYRYVYNQPVLYLDPLGLETCQGWNKWDMDLKLWTLSDNDGENVLTTPIGPVGAYKPNYPAACFKGPENGLGSFCFKVKFKFNAKELPPTPGMYRGDDDNPIFIKPKKGIKEPSGPNDYEDTTRQLTADHFGNSGVLIGPFEAPICNVNPFLPPGKTFPEDGIVKGKSIKGKLVGDGPIDAMITGYPYLGGRRPGDKSRNLQDLPGNPPRVNLLRPDGTWNDIEICYTLENGEAKISTTVNGTPVVTNFPFQGTGQNYGPKNAATKDDKLCLQAHWGSEVQFKDPIVTYGN